MRRDREDVQLGRDEPVIAERDEPAVGARDGETRPFALQLGLERVARPRRFERVLLDLVDRVEVSLGRGREHQLGHLMSPRIARQSASMPSPDWAETANGSRRRPSSFFALLTSSMRLFLASLSALV